MNVSALCILLTVPWVGLQCVIVVFQGHIPLTFSFHFAQFKYKKNNRTVRTISRALLQARRINVLSLLSCYLGLKPIEHICDVK